VYLVFKENIQIATLLKRGNKNVDIKFSAHERFWNNLHQVVQDQKNGKPNNLGKLVTCISYENYVCRTKSD
jgi:hypothetical protein